MTPYRPFLLPLLSGGPHAPKTDIHRQQPGSTLEEESCLEGFLEQEDAVWECLKILVEKAFGLPLICDLPSGYGIAIPSKSATSASPTRFLEIEANGSQWFLIEHPDSIPLIDRFSQKHQKTGIARPSMFARLCRELKMMPEREKRGSIQVEESPGERATALETFLSELLTEVYPSDWHLEPTRDHFRSRVRIDGCLQNESGMTLGRGKWLINSVISRAGLKDIPGMSIDGRLSHQLSNGIRVTLRISLIPSQHGMAMTVRFLYPLESQHLDLKSLGLPEETLKGFSEQYNTSRGLWVIVGPTGSGKSTTLRSLLQLSVQQNEKALSIEDPVEHTLAGAHHLSLGTPPGLTWAGAIRAFLRQAPDAILVGEIRDSETAAIALQAARTGHRILTTLHARDNPGVKRRFLDLGQEGESLDSVFECVLHQRLLRRLCPDCRRLEPVPAEWKNWISRLNLAVPASIGRTTGCSNCHTGYKGRLPIFTSGDFSSEIPVQTELLNSAWNAFLEHQIALGTTIPFIPGELRARFGICQW